MAKWISQLPKFDLHVHLDGSMRPGTVMELVRTLPENRNLPPTLDSVSERSSRAAQRCTLEEYLKAF